MLAPPTSPLTSSRSSLKCDAMKRDTPQQSLKLGSRASFKLPARKCCVCNAEFWPARKHAKTCGDTCRQILSRARKFAETPNARSGRSRSPKRHRSARQVKPKA